MQTHLKDPLPPRRLGLPTRKTALNRPTPPNMALFRSLARPRQVLRDGPIPGKQDLQRALQEVTQPKKTVRI